LIATRTIECTSLFRNVANWQYLKYSPEKKLLAGSQKAILTFPPFAGYDHERVVREKRKLGKIAGIGIKEVLDFILRSPRMAGYSKRRYLAAIDIGRHLARNNYCQEDILPAFLAYYSTSPYVPSTRKERISHVENYEKPPLMVAMEKYCKRRK